MGTKTGQASENKNVISNNLLIYIALSLVVALIDIVFLNGLAVAFHHSIVVWINIVAFVAIAIVCFLAFSMCASAGVGDKR